MKHGWPCGLRLVGRGKLVGPAGVMMNRLLEWLLDLERIRLGDGAPVSLQWQPPFEPYLLFGFSVLLLAFVILVVRREHAARVRRLVLGCLRAALIALLVALS